MTRDANNIARQEGVGALRGVWDKAKPDAEISGGRSPQRGGTDARPLHTYDHGDVGLITPQSLIRNRLPETGVAVLSGQWGTFKTFVGLDIACSVMTGSDFAGQPVYRPGGVLFVAAEGAGDVPLRLAAVAEHKVALSLTPQGDLPLGAECGLRINPKKLPFRWADSCPLLLGEKSDALPRLIATARAADDHFRRDHGVPLVLIVIDTMAAVAGWKDENDNAQAAEVMGKLRQLSEAAGAVVMVVDHFGKNDTIGTRGASAKEAAADAVLAILGDRAPSGGVNNLRLAIRKQRGGPSGEEFPFAAKIVDMGTDDHGFPVTSRVIDWDVAASPSAPRKKPPSRGRAALEQAIASAFAEPTDTVTVDGQTHSAVERQRLLDEFTKVYGSADISRTAVTQAFRDALGKELKSGALKSQVMGGRELLWIDGRGL